MRLVNEVVRGDMTGHVIMPLHATTFFPIHTNEFQLQIQSSSEKSYVDFAS